MLIDPLGKVLSLVVPVLNELGILYYLGGSVASSMHGERRQTNDVDVVADFRLEHVVEFVQRLQSQFYVDEAMIRDAIRHRSSFNIIHFESVYKVDVFIMKDQAYEREVARRRVQDTVEGEPSVEAYVAQAEDVVLAKLRWFKLAGGTSERQWRDVLGVLKLQQFNLDFDYLHHWAGEIGVSDLLERALQDAGIIEESASNGDSN